MEGNAADFLQKKKSSDSHRMHGELFSMIPVSNAANSITTNHY